MNFAVDQAEPRKVYDILVGLVAPRPIALVTSLSETGQVDAAPYSSAGRRVRLKDDETEYQSGWRICS